MFPLCSLKSLKSVHEVCIVVAEVYVGVIHCLERRLIADAICILEVDLRARQQRSANWIELRSKACHSVSKEPLFSGQSR